MVKQVIVMRKDLNMRKGKMVAQGSHASMKVFFDRMFHKRLTGTSLDDGGLEYEIEMTKEMKEWKDNIFTKICVSVDSEQELKEIYESASEQNIPCAIIEDCGLTEFNGVPTLTCCAIGPADAETIDNITGNLKLL